jgi:hypothetical protein
VEPTYWSLFGLGMTAQIGGMIAGIAGAAIGWPVFFAGMGIVLLVPITVNALGRALVSRVEGEDAKLTLTRFLLVALEVFSLMGLLGALVAADLGIGGAEGFDFATGMLVFGVLVGSCIAIGAVLDAVSRHVLADGSSPEANAPPRSGGEHSAEASASEDPTPSTVKEDAAPKFVLPRDPTADEHALALEVQGAMEADRAVSVRRLGVELWIYGVGTPLGCSMFSAIIWFLAAEIDGYASTSPSVGTVLMRVFAVGLIVLAVAFIIRIRHQHVSVSPSGITIVNLVRTHEIPWEQVERVDLGRSNTALLVTSFLNQDASAFGEALYRDIRLPSDLGLRVYRRSRPEFVPTPVVAGITRRRGLDTGYRAVLLAVLRQAAAYGVPAGFAFEDQAPTSTDEATA